LFVPYFFIPCIGVGAIAVRVAYNALIHLIGKPYLFEFVGRKAHLLHALAKTFETRHGFQTTLVVLVEVLVGILVVATANVNAGVRSIVVNVFDVAVVVVIANVIVAGATCIAYPREGLHSLGFTRIVVEF